MTLNIHCISPLKVVKGQDAWIKSIKLIDKLTKRPLILGRSSSTKHVRDSFQLDLISKGINAISYELDSDCCELDINNAYQFSINNNCDGIIAAGGGKVLDAGKLIADLLGINCITVPLSASTCAGWTALSNIYSPDGKFIKDVTLKSCPNLLIFDHNIVRAAPPKTLASGIADAVAKWYESSLTSSTSQDGFVQQAVQMARVLRDQLFLNGYKAFTDPLSNSWVTVAEGCALTAGIIGGLGGVRCRTAAAHSIHNGLTQLAYKNKPLHGELVGFGLLVQLYLEEKNSNSQLPKQAKSQLINFLSQLNLPISIESISLKSPTPDQLHKACKFACKDGSDIHHLPFPINENVLLEAIENYHSLPTSSNITFK
ncbi:iron-containing alcohol dehydrogenase family protein [Prochlorococcus marinus]|uniref:Oxidoreductase n=1 Tax=Prochlorococcus marinus XMU1408 TaxID=2213228 RepID=A0A318RE69_PROMR|nr:iron-containing alcohol dehydrogenase family protein [Prochlorococcus marinus]MBW3042267.1 oxidoreductase [Prochlorococcus marinus str. XMU1408]PYE01655.1 oxidoreductase [Prochlorococcus marinus XMU1408]